MTNHNELDDIALNNFRTYLRFPTVHPDPDYRSALEWLREEGENIGLQCFVTEIIPQNPLLIMRWQGSNPSLRSIMLNSHMDVVPVEVEKWTHDPFGAEMTPDGNIYARGAQDMKCVGIQHLEAVRRLKQSGFVPKRTIYLTYVPDEEVGGGRGMKPFVEGVKPTFTGARHEITFEEMNVGLCLDEGIACPLPGQYYAFYEERSPWWVSFLIPGSAGHGSRFIADTALEKLERLLTQLRHFREGEKKRLAGLGSGDLGLGSVVSTNVNVIRGGSKVNVVPGEIEVQVDFRLPPTLDFGAFEKQLNEWAAAAGEGIQIHYIQKDMGTSGEGGMKDLAEVAADPLLEVLRKATCAATEAHLAMGVFYGSTDARFLRRWHRARPGRRPIRAVGLSPMSDTPVLLHDHDECLHRHTFLAGVRLFKHVLAELAKIDDETLF